MRSAPAIFAVALFACHETTSISEPELAEETRAIILVGAGPEQPAQVHAVDVRPGEAPIFPDLFGKGPLELSMLEYRCPLEQLGLQIGRQALLDAPTASSLIPPPAEVIALHAQPGQTDSWSKGQLTETASAAIRRLNLPENNLCRANAARFEEQVLELPNDERGEPVFTVRLDEEHAFVGSEKGRFYRVDRRGTVEPVTVPVPLPPFDTFAGAYASDDGELWLFSRRGMLVRGSLERGFTVVSTTAPMNPTTQLISLQGPHGDASAPFELYAETDGRDFLRFDGAIWTPLATSPDFGGIFIPDVVWIRPNEALAIGIGQANNSIVRYKDGRTTTEYLDGESGLASIQDVPGLGIVVGRDDGGLFLNRGDGWRPIASHETLFYVRTIAAIGDGFIFGASTERNFLEYRFLQFFPGAGACEPMRLTEVATVGLTPLGSDTLLATTLSGFGDPLGLTILKIASPPHACSGGL